MRDTSSGTSLPSLPILLTSRPRGVETDLGLEALTLAPLGALGVRGRLALGPEFGPTEIPLGARDTLEVRDLLLLTDWLSSSLVSIGARGLRCTRWERLDLTD